jgi:hypothetical protein
LNLAATIANMEAAGMTPDAIVMALKCIVNDAPPAPMTRAERTAKWRESKRDSVTSDVTSSPTPSPLVPPLSPAPLSPPIIPPTLNSPPRKARVRVEDEAFDAFWHEYPRKTAKGSARQAFIKAQDKVENGHLLEAARRYAASKPDPKFTPHPATWLNQERWLDVDCSIKALTEPFQGVSNGQIFVKQGTDAFDAWTDVWKKKSGKSPPVNQNGGWFFPTEYPEDESAEQAV